MDSTFPANTTTAFHQGKLDASGLLDPHDLWYVPTLYAVTIVCGLASLISALIYECNVQKRR